MAISLRRAAGPVPLPNDPLFVPLLFIERGYRLVPDGGRLLAVGRDAAYDPPYLLDALDELEVKNWLVVGDDGPAVTEAGRFHLMKWLKRQGGLARRAVERGRLDDVDFEVRG